jgi:hypothetical protein
VTPPRKYESDRAWATHASFGKRQQSSRRGLLLRRPIFIESSVPIGKESRLAEEAAQGAVAAKKSIYSRSQIVEMR